MRKKIARLAAWAVTIGLLVFLFRRISFANIIEAVKDAEAWAIPAVLGMTLVVYLCDALAMWKTFGWFVTPLRLTEVLLLRGATYLLALINYAVGLGAIVYFIHRSRGVPVVRGAAAVLLIMGTNLLLLLFMATLGMGLGADTIPALRTILMLAYVGLAGYIALVIWKPAFLVKRALFDVLLGAGLGGYIKATAVRIPHIMSLLVLNYLGMHAFGVNVPALQLVLCMPVVLFIAVLPISVQGLGTSQAALTFFFARYAVGNPAMQEARIVAASLATQALSLVVQFAIGVICLRSQMGRTLRDASTTAVAPPAP